MDKIAAEAAKEIAETTFFAGTNPRWQQEQLEKKIFAALSQSLAEREQRIATLRTALKHEVDNCMNCSGTGRYVTHREGGYEFTVTCERCASARAALRVETK